MWFICQKARASAQRKWLVNRQSQGNNRAERTKPRIVVDAFIMLGSFFETISMPVGEGRTIRQRGAKQLGAGMGMDGLMDIYLDRISRDQLTCNNSGSALIKPFHPIFRNR
jgi:hypothetical protein